MSEHKHSAGCGCGPKKAAATPAAAAAAPAAAASTPTPPPAPAMKASESSTGRVTIQNGKGSAPRSISPTFLKNYDGIKWTSAGKKRKEGSKFVKVY